MPLTLKYILLEMLIEREVSGMSWKCEKCSNENGPMRDVFCGKCGERRPGW